MLTHGDPDAPRLLPQLERAKVLPTRCPCGCASIEFLVDETPHKSGPLHTVADFVFGSESNLSGIFVYEVAGVLSGLEVYGLAGDAPKILPKSDSLRPYPVENVNA
jgi:hypothetical protein